MYNENDTTLLRPVVVYQLNDDLIDQSRADHIESRICGGKPRGSEAGKIPPFLPSHDLIRGLLELLWVAHNKKLVSLRFVSRNTWFRTVHSVGDAAQQSLFVVWVRWLFSSLIKSYETPPHRSRSHISTVTALPICCHVGEDYFFSAYSCLWKKKNCIGVCLSLC